MGLLDGYMGLGGLSKVERKSNIGTPKERLISAFEDQIEIANGKVKEVAGNTKNSWRGEDGIAEIKVTDILLDKVKTDTPNDYKRLLENVLIDIQNDTPIGKQIQSEYESKWKEKKSKETKRKRRNELIEMRDKSGLTDNQKEELSQLEDEVGRQIKKKK